MDVQKLLGQFLGHGAGDRQGRMQSARPPFAAGQTNSGGSVVDQIGGMLSGQGGSALTGALVGGLASRLFRGKGVRKLGGSAVKLGAAALVAGLAYKAYQNYQANNAAAGALPNAAPTPLSGPQPTPAGDVPAPDGTAFLPKGEEDRRAGLMLSAMIAAAKADGYIDAEEQQAIFARIDELGLDAEEKGFVMDEMRRPLSVDELASRATSPEIAMEIYTASVLAIDPDHPAERAYLDHLAARLELPSELIAEIRRTAGEVQA